jgi:hypothetical protein
MSGRAGRLLVVVRPGGGRRVREVVRWVRTLLPAAALLIAPVGPAAAPSGDEDDRVIAIDADDLPSGPLSLADAILRRAR